MRLPSDPYVTRLNILVQAARAIVQLADMVNVDELRHQLGQIEALAPVLDPTTFIRGGGLNLADQKVFLDATAAYVEALKSLDRRPSITCPRCKMTSHNPHDVAEGYCGNCQAFTTTRVRTGP